MMAGCVDVFLIALTIFVTFHVKKPCLVSTDSIGLSVAGYELHMEPNNYYMAALWCNKGRKFLFCIRYSRYGVLNILLLLCGDIHSCPGPTQGNVNGFMQRNGLQDICSKKGLKLLHQNIRGLQGNFDEIKSILLRNKIDVFGFSEIFVNKITPDSVFSVPGFTFIRADRKSGTGGGVGLYIRNDIDHTRRTDYESDDYESIWLEIKPKKTKPIIFGIVYRPPDSSKHLSKDFNKSINEILLTLDKEKSETIIMGDLNIDYNKRNDHSSIKCLFTNNGFKQLLKTPTRITSTSATLIDVIQSNNPQNISHTAVIPSGMSDHDLTACVRKMNNIKYEPQTIRCRDYRKYNINEINNVLENADWNQVYQKTSSGEAWNKMEIILKETLNAFAPFILKRIKGKPSPWINDRLKSEMNSRDQCLRKARKSKVDADWKLYKQKRNFVKNEINRAKSSYYKNKLTENATQPENFWKTIKKIFPTQSKECKLSKSFKLNSQTISDNDTIANEFCKFFTTAASNLKRAAFPLIDLVWKPKKIAVHFCRYQFSFRTVTNREVMKHLRNLKHKCAVGLDEIPSSFLKDTAYIIAKPLTHVINCSLRGGIVPEQFKQAKVTPVYKSGASDSFDNYRPISVLPAVSKILERCVHDQLMEHLENHNLLTASQFGFRKKRSTEHASVYFTDQIRKAMDNGLLTGAIYIDLSKAFDTISHSTLIEKLPDFGVTGITQDWFTNYLFSRHQRVICGDRLSSREPVLCGVPQGSILGPLLFILYFNDLATVLTKCKIIKYADDTVIFYSHKDLKIIQNVLNEEFSNITKWLKKSELVINIKKGKTEVMTFGTSKRLNKTTDEPIMIKHQGTTLNCTNKYKYLGLNLNSTLNMSEHVQISLKKTASRLRLLKKARQIINAKTAAQIYNAMIIPILNYCCLSTYGAVSTSLNEKAMALERRAQRIVGGTVLLPSLGTVQMRRIVTFVHRCTFGTNINSYFENYFEVQSSRYNTRNNGCTIRLPRVKLEAARSSCYFQGAVAFNSLPYDVRSEKNFSKFKSFLKKL